jgi:phosphoenolpyruvate-protein kinase (PTS system EI component)
VKQVDDIFGGIVLEIGGQLSHGVIIAHEYGIPAIGLYSSSKCGMIFVVPI